MQSLKDGQLGNKRNPDSNLSRVIHTWHFRNPFHLRTGHRSPTGDQIEFTMPPTSAVLLPLYIYPLPGAWDPLHSAIADNPNLQFIIILNPHNGPGASSRPDEDYSREIPKLTSKPNVVTLGYVRIDYCKRNVTEVFRDVAKYAGWSKDNAESGLGVHGIFLDETPNLYSASKASYLDTISQYIKTQSFSGDRLVIHNPGTVPDPKLANPGPDITTVVEESFATYQSASLQQRLGSLLRYKRDKCAYMVHSVPEAEMQSLVQELRHRGEFLFVTDLCSNYYCSFGSSWKRFIEVMQN